MDKSFKHFTDEELLEEALKVQLKLGCSQKKKKEILSELEVLENNKKRFGLCCDVPNNKCCYFCLKEKPCLHEHKVRMEGTSDGIVYDVYFFPYRVCVDCQKKLLARGIKILSCALLLGAVVGMIFSLLLRINCPSINSGIKIICGVCYAAALVSLLHKQEGGRLNFFWLLASALFFVVSFPILLHLRSLSRTLCVCFVMTISFPTILFSFRKAINLFSKLHGRVLY